MALLDGDLAISKSNGYEMVTGTQKVAQDVRGALLEPLGNDRFHPGWGSILRDYVGLSLDPFLKQQVMSEVNRVTGNYAAVQRDRVTTDEISGSQTSYTTDEIIAAVTGVTLKERYDTLQFSVKIATVAGTGTVISEALG